MQRRSDVFFLLPGSLDTATGGYRYDRRIVAGLRESGQPVTVCELNASFPQPDAAALDHAAAVVARLPDDACVIADALAFGAMPDIALQHASRLRWLALVHHPLALETGLSTLQSEQFARSERAALAAARCVVATSRATARTLTAHYAVPAARMRVIEPGTEPAPLAQGSGPGAAAALLCVATLTPRKGHAVLIEALAGLQERRWTLQCVGSLSRDAAAANALRDAIAAQGLQPRIELLGELDEAGVAACYARSDAVVLASYHEGYGMVLTEALARGIPVISTTAGAIADTVPAGAGVLVPPGDAAALRTALARWLDEPSWRAHLRSGALAARPQLPTWAAATAAFAAAVDHVNTLHATGEAPP